MSAPQMIEKTPMNVVQLKDALTKIQKSEEGMELNFRAQKAMEYAEDFAKLPLKEAEELLSELQKLDVPRLKDAHLHKLIDLLPQSEKSVKVILSASHVTVSAEHLKKIADVLQNHPPKA